MGTARVEAKEKEGTRAGGSDDVPPKATTSKGAVGRPFILSEGSSAGASQGVVADPAGGVCGHGGAAPG